MLCMGVVKCEIIKTVYAVSLFLIVLVQILYCYIIHYHNRTAQAWCLPHSSTAILL